MPTAPAAPGRSAQEMRRGQIGQRRWAATFTVRLHPRQARRMYRRVDTPCGVDVPPATNISCGNVTGLNGLKGIKRGGKSFDSLLPIQAVVSTTHPPHEQPLVEAIDFSVAQPRLNRSNRGG